MKNVINILSDFETIDENAENEASASAISLNPNVSWAKFIFTDDLPNVNLQRIPLEEFPNILKTGVHMPIKMATGKIEDGHENSVPLGTIAQLKVDGNKVLGLAALWLTERPDDVQILKDRNASGAKPQLSWEVYYKDMLLDEETGVKTLQNVCVKATTIVNIPAYAGRTPILAIASDANKPVEDKNVEELQKEYDALKVELETLKATLAEKEKSLATVNTELTTLKEYKASIEKIETDKAKISAIKQKFSDAGIQKSDEYFMEKQEQFLGLEDSEVDFLVQELASLASLKAEASTKNPTLPNLTANPISTDPKELAKALLEKAMKKK
jgi:hypothetical protein